MLDATAVETIVPESAAPQPELPAVLPPPTAAAAHRVVKAVPDQEVASAGWSESLTRSSMEVELPPVDERPPPTPSMPSVMTWTAEEGFVGADPTDTEPPAVDAAADAPALRYVPAPRREYPPRDVVDLVQRATGVDVGDAVIDRSPDVSRRASDMGAVAFTERGTVHLPSELGEVARPETKAIVAHELTHVAQQRERRSDLPAESSDEGRELERQARQVQHDAGGTAVVPTVLRRAEHAPAATGPVAGVQRLASGGDDQYGWQGRDEEYSPSRTREALGLFGGYSWRRGSVGDRAVQREDEGWRRDFEHRHRDDLLDARREHYDELAERALELKRARLAGTDTDPSEIELGRGEVIELRERLDRDMPFEFELPPSVDPYPGELPDAADDDERDAAVLRRSLGRGADTGRDPGPASIRRPPVSSASSGGRPRTPPSPPGRPGRNRAGGDQSEGFDWQRREPTPQQAVASMFGGGLLGDLLGKVVGEETDDDRRAAEMARLPQLNQQRQDRELELRHRMLRDRLRERTTDARREEREPPTTPISLTDEDVTAIRTQIDEDMPLQFAVPTFLDRELGTQISATGEISDGAPAASVDEDEATEADGDEDDESSAPGDVDESDAPESEGDADGAAADADVDDETEAEDDDDVDTDDDAAEPATGAAGARLLNAASLVSSLSSVAGDDDGDDRATSGESVDAEATSAAASDVFAGASELDIDLLSRRVWSRIRREMRTELLIDRERAGALADHR